jgi:hypothetical protein
VSRRAERSHLRYDFKPRARPQTLPPARLRHLARQVHALGERPLYELLTELEAGLPFAERVEAYAGLADLGPFIKAHGGDRLPIARVVTPTRKGRGAL